MKCWAELLGGCADGQSQEHYISKGLYGGMVKAIGLPWAKGEEVNLPIDSLKANILCEHHNNMLSPVDGEAIRFRKAVADAMVAIMSPNTVSAGTTYTTLDGEKIIRWLCKTICNLETLAKRGPDPRLVRRAFGADGGQTVHLYGEKAFPSRRDGDTSHIRWFPWNAELKDGGTARVFIMRFANFEWLISPFPLTQDQCDALGHLSQTRYWFRNKPLRSTTALPVYVRGDGGKLAEIHRVTLKFPRKRRRRR